MFENLDFGAILAIIICILLAFIAWWTFRDTRQKLDGRKQMLAEMEQEEQAEELPAEPEAVAVTARVIDKRFSSDVIGTKSVKQVSSYFVTFFTEDGETVEYPVPEEIFLQIEKGQESTLVTVDGQFFDFGDGEDAPEE
ncbi:MAG: hypothetical protein J6R82_01940 [Clostridia bacterium]|nr:hypothetical protein [Clostridia bacterium]